MQKQQKNGNFVQKLDKLLKSQAFSDIICWDSSKTIIDVLDVKRMESQIIPKFFRHQKFESFVRQLNLYGFRKIKLQGRHRFTHPLLLSGQQLTSIISLKSLKNDKGSKETVQSPVLLENRPPVPQVNQILLNSMENGRQTQPLSQQTNVIFQMDPSGSPRLPGNMVFMMPGNYFNFWNFNPFMGSNMPNMPIMAPFIPQK